jgi:plastocyanin
MTEHRIADQVFLETGEPMTIHTRVARIWGALLAIGVGALANQPCPADEQDASLPAAAARLEGVVTYDGPLPAPVPVAEAATVRQLVEVNRETGGLKDVVVWLEGVPAPAQTEPATRKPAVVMDQRNFFFIPHVLSIDAGQEVEFRSSDVANHGVTAASSEPSNCFNVSLALGESYKHRFVTSAHPVAIGCPVHVSMAAWVYVFGHPYHAVTDDQGRFRLPPVPSGQYTLQVRHPDGGMRSQRPVPAQAGETVHLRIEYHESDLRAGLGSSRRNGVESP